MRRHFSRRDFVKSSLLASAAIPLTLGAQSAINVPPAPIGASPESQVLPKGKIANLELSRLIMGGNLIGGWSHSRDLGYVSTLMRRYNTPSKIRETLELGEQNGITAINTWVMDDNSQLFEHWKNGGKMHWISQVRLDAGGGYSQSQRAIAEGAVGIHLTGDTAERLLGDDKFEKVGEAVQYIRSQKRVAGVAAHDLRVIIECEKRKLDVDFYQKTLHTNEYFTGTRPDEPDRVSKNDNSWCSNAQAVIDVFAKITKPWIAFKILAAGAIQPRAAFPYSVNGGADFILVGMFDWQVEDNAKLARRVFSVASGPNSKRTRPWYGGNVAT
ncbi:MAG TPA: hypothetical protein VNZ64_13005 [Candidatus Acidoferrum sp.]|jgi:hypothetical protein|nr:hypothetical protein [Candidatus Acidoferrum sp.]